MLAYTDRSSFGLITYKNSVVDAFVQLELLYHPLERQFEILLDFFHHPLLMCDPLIAEILSINLSCRRTFLGNRKLASGRQI